MDFQVVSLYKVFLYSGNLKGAYPVVYLENMYLRSKNGELEIPIPDFQLMLIRVISSESTTICLS